MSKDSEFDRLEWLIDSPPKLDPLIREDDALMSIFACDVLFVSVKTARKSRKQDLDKIACEAQ